METRHTRSWMKAGAIGLAGLGVGAVLAGTLTANAEGDSSGTPDNGSSTAAQPGAPTGNQDLSRPQRSDEHLLGDAVTAKVEDVALAKYPGATVARIESDSDGVYEAHLTRADGTPVTVEVDKSFAITGHEDSGPGGHEDPGDHHGPWGPPGGQRPHDDSHSESPNDT